MSTKTKILIAEHDAADLELLLNELKISGIDYVSQIVDNGEDYGNALKNFIPDLILSDYSFPSFDGPAAFKMRQEIAPEIPFIFVTGALGEEVSVALIKNGVTDYVLKDKLFTLNSKIKRSLKESFEKQEKNYTDDKNRVQAVLLNTIGQAVMAADLNGVINFWNNAAEVMYGWTAEEAVGANVLDLIPSQQTKEQAAEIMSALYQGNSWSGELVMQRKDGTRFTAFLTDSPVYDSQHNLSGIIGISSDLTERKGIEEKLNKANRLYSFISQINKTITLEKEERFLFKEACSTACDKGKFNIAWVGKLDKTHKTITLEEQCGIPLENLSLFSNTSYEKNGPQDYVLSTGKSYISNNIEAELKLLKWKEFATKNQLLSCMVLPLKKAGEIIATFNLYSSELNFFDAAEVQILEVVATDISFGIDLIEKEKKQRQSEELILQSENRFRSLIEHSRDMKTLSSPGGKLLYGSPSITGVLGYSINEYLNLNAYDLIHPDDAPDLEESMAMLKTPGKSLFGQQRLKHKNGRWVWCEGTVTNMLHESGINALVSNFRDISDKKIIDGQREFDNNNLNALINNTSDLMWSVDRDFNLITSNFAFDEMSKVNFGGIVPKGANVLSTAYTAEMHNYFKQLYERAFNGETFIETSYFDTPVEFWTEISYNPIRQGDEIIGTACHSRDITERKRTENKLTRSEARLKEAQTLVHISNWEIDLVTGISTWSDEFYNILGISRADVEPSPEAFLSYIHPDDFKYAKEEVDKTLRTFKSSSFNSKIKSKDGTPVYVYSEWKFAFDKNNKPVRVYGILQDITERKLAETKLKQSEAALREAESIAHVGNFAKDMRGGTEIWSDEFYKIFGFTKDEITPSPETFLSFVHPEDKNIALQKIKGGFENFKDYSFTARCITKDLRIIICYAECRFELDKNKKAIRLFGVIQDITEQKKAELIISESEARLAEAQALAKVGNWETDLLTGKVIWSEQSYRIFDCQPDDFKSTHPDFLTFVHPDDRTKVDIAFKNSFVEKSITAIEHRIQTKTGQIKFVEERWQIIHDKNNIALRAVGTCQDITERKKSENENKFKAELLATIGQAVMATDLNGNVTFWNKAAVDIYGWNNEEVIGKNILDITPSTQTKKEAEIIIKKLSKGESWSGEFYVRRKDGSIFPAFVTNSPVYDEFGNLNGIIGVSNDISERKENELERTKITNDLIQRNREMEQFTFIISHNLRAPTANIIGYADNLSEGTLTTEEQDEFIKGLSVSAKNLDTIIKDINKILQVKRDAEEEKEIISFSSLVNEIFISLTTLIDKHHVRIKHDFSEADEIYSLKGYMHSIFHNLISNSIKYRKPDVDPFIEIKSKKENGKIMLTFKDNGLGIDMKTKGDKVFGLYKRFHSHVEGKGMGLFMVKTQVEAIGGKITVASELNKGTEFTIVFEDKLKQA